MLTLKHSPNCTKKCIEMACLTLCLMTINALLQLAGNTTYIKSSLKYNRYNSKRGQCNHHAIFFLQHSQVPTLKEEKRKANQHSFMKWPVKALWFQIKVIYNKRKLSLHLHQNWIKCLSGL